MYVKNDRKNCQINSSELLKSIRESICSIRETINYMNADTEKAGMPGQLMFGNIYELFMSLRYLLKLSYRHAKSPGEIHDMRQTHDLVKQACMELKQIALLSTN